MPDFISIEEKPRSAVVLGGRGWCRFNIFVEKYVSQLRATRPCGLHGGRFLSVIELLRSLGLVAPCSGIKEPGRWLYLVR